MVVTEKLDLYLLFTPTRDNQFTLLLGPKVVTSTTRLVSVYLGRCDFHTLLQPMKEPTFNDHVKAVALIL